VDDGVVSAGIAGKHGGSTRAFTPATSVSWSAGGTRRALTSAIVRARSVRMSRPCAQGVSRAILSASRISGATSWRAR
jgi:hypothetical protein